MSEVRLENVTKKFGEVIAVDNVTLNIADKEFVVLLGPSGCGKTTVLRLIAGLEEPTAGKIYIDNKLVNDVPPQHRDIAMVFQSYALYPHMSVYDNISFGLRMRKVKKEEIDEKVKKASHMLGIQELLNRKPKQLSGGQRQRVALARAIVREPKAFLMDEPLSNLDAKLRTQTRTELIKLHRSLGITTIYVTHDQLEAMTMAQRIVLLKDGVIQQIAPPIELYNKPANKFVASFIGTPAMNFIDMNIMREGEKLYLQEEGIKLTLTDEAAKRLTAKATQRVTLGIRPENIYIEGISPNYDANYKLTYKVDVIEPLGEESIITASLVNRSITIKLNKVLPYSYIDKQVNISFDIEKIHLFDIDSGERLIA